MTESVWNIFPSFLETLFPPSFYPIILSPPSLIVSLSSLLIGYYIGQRREGVRTIKELCEEINKIYTENTREYKKVLFSLVSMLRWKYRIQIGKGVLTLIVISYMSYQGYRLRYQFFDEFILSEEFLYLSGGVLGVWVAIYLLHLQIRRSQGRELKNAKSHSAHILMQHLNEYLFKELIIVWKQSVLRGKEKEKEEGRKLGEKRILDEKIRCGVKCKLEKQIQEEELRRHQRLLGHVINFEWCSLCSLRDTTAHGADAMTATASASTCASTNIPTDASTDTSKPKDLARRSEKNRCKSGCVEKFLEIVVREMKRFIDADAKVIRVLVHRLDLIMQNDLLLKEKEIIK